MFDARVERDPYWELRRICIARGLVVNVEDLPSEYTNQLEALPKAMRPHFQMEHALDSGNERQALNIARNCTAILGRRVDDAASKAAAERKARIRARAIRPRSRGPRRPSRRARAQAERGDRRRLSARNRTSPRPRRTNTERKSA